MIVKSPTREQQESIFTLADSLGIKSDQSHLESEDYPDVWFSGECILNCEEELYSRLKIPVTFQEFITAMVTPEEKTDKEIEEMTAKSMTMENAIKGAKKLLDKYEPFLSYQESKSLKELFNDPFFQAGMSAAKKQEEKAKQFWESLKDVSQPDLIVKVDLSDDSWLGPRTEAMVRKLQEAQKMAFQRINPREVELEAENKALKEKLAEAEKREMRMNNCGQLEYIGAATKEDKRMNFGKEIKFGLMGDVATIGYGLAKKGDENKVLIAKEGYTFKIRENYFDGRPALEIHRI